jgi:hypothetical protein
LIKGFANKAEVGTATGFFFSSNNKVWLVTNKHVIYGDRFAEEDAKPEVDEFGLLLHINREDFTKNEEVSIPLFIDSKRNWLEHSERNIDLICLPIALDRTKYHFVTIADDLLDSEKLKIGFEKIFVMGYPFGWYDSTHNLPITRIGHLSSPYKVPFRGVPIMLGDVETHKGMSGSPVFMYLKDYVTEDENGGLVTNIGAYKHLLLGVFSGQPLWPVVDSITNNTINIPHSLSIIWFGTLIQDILRTDEVEST